MPLAFGVDRREARLDWEVEARLFDDEAADPGGNRPQRREDRVGFDLALEEGVRRRLEPVLLQRAVGAGADHVVVEDDVEEAGGAALEEARQLVLVIVEESERTRMAGDQLRD